MKFLRLQPWLGATTRVCGAWIAALALSLNPATAADTAPPPDLGESTPSPREVNARYALALQALANGQTALARATLEQIVAVRPDFAGAWLDLAIATYQDGDTTAAIEHLEYLRQRFPLSAFVNEQVNDWLARWQSASAQPRPARSWQAEWFLNYGYDSNANSGLANNTLTLTGPSGAIALPVERSYLPRADHFVSFGISAQGPSYGVEGGRLRPLLILRSKFFAHATAYSSLDLQTGIEYLRPAAWQGSWRLAGFLQHYQLGGSGLYNSARFNLQRVAPWQHCQAALGSELEGRWYRRLDTLGGNFIWLSTSLGCPLGEGQLALLGRLGHESPHRDRAGGHNTPADILLHYTHPLPRQSKLELALQASRILDARGYSALLEDNARRRIARQSATLTFSQRLDNDWAWQLALESQHQGSNLPLFEQRRYAIAIGISRRY